MRPRINSNLCASSSKDSSSARIAQYNRKNNIFMTTSKPKEVQYITFFGKEYIIGKDITIEDVKKANLIIKTKII